MHAASQLPGRGPLMWMMSLHLHVNQKSDYDYDMIYKWAYTNLPYIVGQWSLYLQLLPYGDTWGGQTIIFLTHVVLFSFSLSLGGTARCD